MIFRTTYNREMIDKSLTYKNSSENFSVSQSMPDDSEKINREAMHRVSSQSSYVNKVNSSGMMNASLTLPVTSQQRNIMKYNLQEIKPTAVNSNIYYQAHQMNLLKRLREQKEIKNINTNDRVREESLEEIGEFDDDNDH